MQRLRILTESSGTSIIQKPNEMLRRYSFIRYSILQHHGKNGFLHTQKKHCHQLFFRCDNAWIKTAKKAVLIVQPFPFLLVFEQRLSNS